MVHGENRKVKQTVAYVTPPLPPVCVELCEGADILVGRVARGWAFLVHGLDALRQTGGVGTLWWTNVRAIYLDRLQCFACAVCVHVFFSLSLTRVPNLALLLKPNLDFIPAVYLVTGWKIFH